MAALTDQGALLATVRAAGLTRGTRLAVCLDGSVGVGLATAATADGQPGRQWAVAGPDAVAVVAELERELSPRWIWWSIDTAQTLVRAGVRPARCWDLAAVHRLLFGGWSVDAGGIWAALADLDAARGPVAGQLTLLDAGGDEGSDAEDPVRPDGYLRPEWTSGGWARTPQRLARWADTAARAAERQTTRLGALPAVAAPLATATAESAAELLCAELWVDGLPIDVGTARALITSIVGPRPTDAADAALARRRRDDALLRLLPPGPDVDLRSPAQVRTMLGRLGVDVPDTRSWRLEPLRGSNPVIDGLLAWRKAERIATTYGWDWLERHVDATEGRLRGRWSGSDGAAGRMTAQAGLHNLPTELRSAVAAGPGWVFIRADLGQIEPRVLAAVSGDQALVRATAEDDLYAPVAARLGVTREVAKVAVLAAMYGQTSGAAGQALAGLESAYPAAMRYLTDADRSGRAGRDLRTYGGRLIRLGGGPAVRGGDPAADAAARAAVAGRGRYARNALVQGAAAELFKVWAVTVRARGRQLPARVVLCLHDELLVHVPAAHAEAGRQLVQECLAEAARRWHPSCGVRFVADVSVIERWSQAKTGPATTGDQDGM